MHREIAKMLEEAAYQQLKLLETKVIGKLRALLLNEIFGITSLTFITDNTSDTITDLQSILQYFSDAAQSFIKVSWTSIEYTHVEINLIQILGGLRKTSWIVHT